MVGLGEFPFVKAWMHFISEGFGDFKILKILQILRSRVLLFLKWLLKNQNNLLRI